MSPLRKVPFQKWRIFFFGLGMAIKGGRSKSPQYSAACAELVALSEDCLKACHAGPEAKAKMVASIEHMQNKPPVKDMLTAMLDGTHESVPEWLRKDR